MKNLKRRLLAGAMLAFIVPAGAFAQRGGDKRPPKDTPKVVEKPKDQKPPRNDNRGDKSRGDKRGRP